jgi:hypothetical protein
VAGRITRCAGGARLTSPVSIGLIIAFATVDPKVPTPDEWLMLALFPIGVVLGMIVGWWREVLGGLIGTTSLIAFYLMFLSQGNAIGKGVWFAVFAFPATLFLAAGLVRRAGLRSAQ